MDLKTARWRRRISQAELARRIGRTQPYVSALESGRSRRPSYADVIAIAKVLGYAPRTLFPASRDRSAG